MKKTILVATLALAVAFGFAAVGSAADGKTLYARCAGCHGADGGKFKSKAEADILAALKGYKAKSFGGEKKAVMEGIAGNLSEEDMAALAQYVSKL